MYFRLSYVDEFNADTGLGLQVPGTVGATRWTPSTRSQVKCFIDHYPAWVELFNWVQDNNKGL